MHLSTSIHNRTHSDNDWHKNANLVENIVNLQLSCFVEYFIQQLKKKVNKETVNQRPGQLSWYSDQHQKKTRRRTLRSCFLLNILKLCSTVGETKAQMSQPIRGDMVAILFSRSAKTHKLGRGRKDLASWQVSLKSGQRFQRIIHKYLNKSVARAVSLTRQNTNLVEDVNFLLPVKKKKKKKKKPRKHALHTSYKLFSLILIEDAHVKTWSKF